MPKSPRTETTQDQTQNQSPEPVASSVTAPVPDAAASTNEPTETQALVPAPTPQLTNEEKEILVLIRKQRMASYLGLLKKIDEHAKHFEALILQPGLSEEEKAKYLNLKETLIKAWNNFRKKLRDVAVNYISNQDASPYEFISDSMKIHRELTDDKVILQYLHTKQNILNTARETLGYAREVSDPTVEVLASLVKRKQQINPFIELVNKIEKVKNYITSSLAVKKQNEKKIVIDNLTSLEESLKNEYLRYVTNIERSHDIFIDDCKNILDNFYKNTGIDKLLVTHKDSPLVLTFINLKNYLDNPTLATKNEPAQQSPNPNANQQSGAKIAQTTTANATTSNEKPIPVAPVISEATQKNIDEFQALINQLALPAGSDHDDVIRILNEFKGKLDGCVSFLFPQQTLPHNRRLHIAGLLSINFERDLNTAITKLKDKNLFRRKYCELFKNIGAALNKLLPVFSNIKIFPEFTGPEPAPYRDESTKKEVALRFSSVKDTLSPLQLSLIKSPREVSILTTLSKILQTAEDLHSLWQGVELNAIRSELLKDLIFRGVNEALTDLKKEKLMKKNHHDLFQRIYNAVNLYLSEEFRLDPLPAFIEPEPSKAIPETLPASVKPITPPDAHRLDPLQDLAEPEPSNTSLANDRPKTPLQEAPQVSPKMNITDISERTVTPPPMAEENARPKTPTESVITEVIATNTEGDSIEELSQTPPREPTPVVVDPDQIKPLSNSPRHPERSEGSPSTRQNAISGDPSQARDDVLADQKSETKISRPVSPVSQTEALPSLTRTTGTMFNTRAANESDNNAQIKVAVEMAKNNYAKWYEILTKGTADEQKLLTQDVYRGKAGFLTKKRHGIDGQNRAEALNKAVQTSEDPIKLINEFLKGEDPGGNNKPTRYHVHSFASFLLDALRNVPGNPWKSVKPDKKTNRYDEKSVLEAISKLGGQKGVGLGQ